MAVIDFGGFLSLLTMECGFQTSLADFDYETGNHLSKTVQHKFYDLYARRIFVERAVFLHAKRHLIKNGVVK